MRPASRKLAGILFVVLPTVAFGGVSLLSMIVGKDNGYLNNQVRQDLWRAGHAHAGVLLVLSLLILRYVDEADLSEGWKRFVRNGTPLCAILIPFAFFFSVLSPDATEPNGLIHVAYAGFGILTITLLVLGIGLLKAKQ